MVDVPLLEDALVNLLRLPDNNTGDANRDAAADHLQSMTYDVSIYSRPQGSSPLAITIERAGGIPIRNVDAPDGKTISIVDFTFWYKDVADNRSGVRSVYEMLQLVRTILPGWSGTMQGVEITAITAESEPFVADEQPRHADDGWTSKVTMSYTVYWKRFEASQVIV